MLEVRMAASPRGAFRTPVPGRTHTQTGRMERQTNHTPVASSSHSGRPSSHFLIGDLLPATQQRHPNVRLPAAQPASSDPAPQRPLPLQGARPPRLPGLEGQQPTLSQRC